MRLLQNQYYLSQTFWIVTIFERPHKDYGHIKDFPRSFQLVSCMFSVHYFFENEDMLNGFVKNVGENLENNGKLSGSDRTKHINVRHHCAKDCIDRKELTIEFCGADDMWADFHAKPSQGEKFEEFEKIMLNIEE